LGHGLPGTTAAAASLGEESLQAAGVPGPDFLHRPQGVQFCETAAYSGEPSQWEFWGLISCTGFWNRRTKPVCGHRSDQAQFLSCCWGNGACWLVPSVTCGETGDVEPAYTGVVFSLAFQGEGSRSCTGESVELRIPVCAGQRCLPPSNGAWSCAETSEVGDREW
jgi:hypothetical protein